MRTMARIKKRSARAVRDLRVHVCSTEEFAKITVISGVNGLEEVCSEVLDEAREDVGRADGILFTTYRNYDGAHLWTCRLYNLDPLVASILERMREKDWPVHDLVTSQAPALAPAATKAAARAILPPVSSPLRGRSRPAVA
ncbi:MAG: hypothetical protein ACE15D_06510 [Candidatus Eisenbacteria bacterium]|nr:hypothetical protein [Candidatus Eisenbacteria bacterium]